MKELTRPMKLILFLVVPLMLLSINPAYAIPIPAGWSSTDLATVVSMEATAEALGDLMLIGGPPPPFAITTIGNWQGVVTGTGWTYNFVGSLRGVPITLTQTGIWNASSGIMSWSTNGIAGGEPVTSEGSLDGWKSLLAWLGVDAVSFGVQTVAEGAFLPLAPVGVGVAGIVGLELLSLALTEVGTHVVGVDHPFDGGLALPSFPPLPRPVEARWIAHNIYLGEIGFESGTGAVAFTALAVGTPEPSTMLLLGSGLVGLAAYRRFKKL